MFEKAGITSPPKTMDELTADAKRLTVKNPDGSIKVAGFVPLNLWEELDIADIGHSCGAQWFDSSGKAQLATDPAWTQAFEWQKSAGRLVRLREPARSSSPRTRTPSSTRRTRSRPARWRWCSTASGGRRSSAASTPHLNVRHGARSRRPTPVRIYGSGRVGGTIVGIPQGATHPQEAWDPREVPGDRHELPRRRSRTASGTCRPRRRRAARRSSTWGRSSTTFVDVWNEPDVRASTRRSCPRARATRSWPTTSTPSGRRGTSPTCRPGLQQLDTQHRQPAPAGGDAVARTASRSSA